MEAEPALSAGDLEALIPYAYATAARIARTEEESADLAQEALVRAWEKRGQLAGKESARAWLRRIILSCYLEQVRRQAIRPDWNRALPDRVPYREETIPDPGLPPLERLLANEAVLAMRNGCFLAMARKLTLEQRIVFSLSCMFHMSVQEIADLTGSSEGAVKALLHRGRANIGLFFHSHCEWVCTTADCHCEEWVRYLADRESNRVFPERRILDTLPEEPPEETVNRSRLERILAVYRSMPDRLPPAAWYKDVQCIIRGFRD